MMQISIKTNEAGKEPAEYDNFNLRIISLNDFYRIDVSKTNLSNNIGMGEIIDKENIKEDDYKHVKYAGELAKETSLKNPHIISIYKISEDKYYGPFVGPAIPVNEIPGLQEALDI